ncbi:hypothetical protein [Marinifilum sp.]|uniref:hypothetical protein n=1 Tax=Marinifilum sp. TaxID=2033137 RepID=UPI003BACADCD
MKDRRVLLKFDDDRIQCFLAGLSFVEANQSNSIFIVDSENGWFYKEIENIIKFKTEYIAGVDEDKISEKVLIKIDHKSPSTNIVGKFKAPLIYPKYIQNTYFKSVEDKLDQLYFRGLLTKDRLWDCLRCFIVISDFKAVIKLVISVLRRKREFIIQTSKVYFCFTARGRNKDFKFLDDEYFEEMRRFKLIYCPKGVYVWTYRFFEAIQLGSIPVVKDSCDHYSSFNYLNYKKTKQKLLVSNIVINNLKVFNANYTIKSSND